MPGKKCFAGNKWKYFLINMRLIYRFESNNFADFDINDKGINFYLCLVYS